MWSKYSEKHPATDARYVGCVQMNTTIRDHELADTHILSSTIRSHPRGYSKKGSCPSKELQHSVGLVISGAVQIHNKPRKPIHATMNDKSPAD